jgi:uncharacterized protein (TIGR02284 family)
MVMETKTTLAKSTVKKLQELIQINIDSYNGFNEAADQVSDTALAELFRDLGAERSAQASELQSIVAANAEDPRDEGSMAAAAHRTWMDLRAALSSDDVGAVLSEAERGEDYIKDKYEDVLKEPAGSAVNDVIQRQFAAVKATHDRIRDMRDEHKSRR